MTLYRTLPTAIPIMLAIVVALLLTSSGCDAVQSDGSEMNAGAELAACPPTAPDPTLAAPDGNRLFLTTHATGVQIYTCQQAAAGPAWVFAFPEATLARDDGKLVVFHFAGPTWEALDQSTVVGARVAGVTVDPTAIPWLLLSASATTGDGTLSKVTFIQRFDTVGGIAPPATTCDAAHLGAATRVPYSATYLFYKAGKAPKSCNLL